MKPSDDATPFDPVDLRSILNQCGTFTRKLASVTATPRVIPDDGTIIGVFLAALCEAARSDLAEFHDRYFGTAVAPAIGMMAYHHEDSIDVLCRAAHLANQAHPSPWFYWPWDTWQEGADIVRDGVAFTKGHGEHR